MSTDIISYLFDHGTKLEAMLREAKTNPNRLNINETVERVTIDLIDRLKNEVGSFPSEDSLVKILQKIKWTLTEFTWLDPTNEQQYRRLVTSVVEYVSTITSPPADRGPRHQYPVVSRDIDHDFVYTDVEDPEKCMLALLCLLPDGVSIKKRHLFLWCKSYFSDVDDKFYENCLTNFVDKGLIQVETIVDSDSTRLASPVVAPDSVRLRATKSPLVYRLHDEVRDNIKSEGGYAFDKRNSLSVLSAKTFGGPVPVVLRINGHTLDAKTFDRTSTMTWAYLIHIGDWKDDPTTYIVVQDTDAMDRAFKRSQSMPRFLSLQGVSGIVDLPRGIYTLLNLKILILRGCHNLETIPDGIESLSCLEYLDLSECYLLNHIPRGISALQNLTVLKGFIIPENQDHARSQAVLCGLSKLEKLRKLTLRNRRPDFPTNADLQTLCELKSLISLKVTWVGVSSSINQIVAKFEVDGSRFPSEIKKFEIEAAPENIATRLMELIAGQSGIKLEKFYIRGGGLRKLVPINVDCNKVLRLHYLPELELSCHQMKRDYPKLHRLEMSSDVIYSLLRQSFKRAIGRPEAQDSQVSWNQSLK